MDQVLVRDLLAFCVKAAQTLGVDKELQQKWKTALGQLPPLMIGKKRQLQEWLEDFEEAQPEHRHLSHLYALYPGEPNHPASYAGTSRSGSDIGEPEQPGRPGGHRIYRGAVRTLLRPIA